MSLSELPGDIILDILERCDTSSIRNLLFLSCFYPFIRRYEGSIVLNKHRQCLVCPSLGGSDSLLSHKVDDTVALETGSSEATPEMSLVPLYSFKAAMEMERREHEVEVLLNSPFLRLRPGPSGKSVLWPHISGPDTRANLRTILKGALAHCNILADMTARAVKALNHPTTRYNYYPGDDGSSSSSRATYQLLLVGMQPAVNDIWIPGKARELQAAYLDQLPDESLLGLACLAEILAESWHERRFSGPKAPVDDAVRRQEHAFGEAALRHGSWYLYSALRGTAGRARHGRRLFEATLGDLDREDGEEGSARGLLGRLRRRLGERWGGGEWEGEKLRGEVYKRVGEMIGAPKAFENPPMEGIRQA